MHRVLVTGIGGNVGQGVLRNIKAFMPEIYIIGTDISDFTVGSRYCDKYYQVPFSKDPTYPKSIKEIYNKEDIDLVIPTTDYETYYIGLTNLNSIVSSPLSSLIFLDKYKTFSFFKETSIPFADSVLPSNWNNNWEEYIVKPREGRGSRNISVNPANVKDFDDTYICQELLRGQEITTAFYVTKKRELHGMISFLRTLQNGTTNMAEVTFDFDKEIEQIIHKLISNYDIKGPCNIQSIVTDRGILPFEINCRYSGTNSIRSQFGFEDVRYGIEEYLLEIEPTIPNISSGTAHRIYVDVIYKNQTQKELVKNQNLAYSYIY